MPLLPPSSPESALMALLAWLAVPQHGLSALFAVSFLSATLLPLGSEPALLGLVALRPDLLAAAWAVATVGNTLGSVLTWGLGWGARRVARRRSANGGGGRIGRRALAWLQRLGPTACALAWLPVVGDALSAGAGWLRLPFWPCVGWLAAGKLVRYGVLLALAQGGVPHLFGG